MKDEPLSLEQVAELADKTLANSLDLLDEAEVLFNRSGHDARAFALAVLAAEEFGKHLMTFSAAAYADVPSDFWKDFWRRFTRHEPKYANMMMLALQGVPVDRRQELSEHFDDLVKADQTRKMAALYVDVVDGVVKSPRDAVTEADWSGTHSVLTELIRGWDTMWSGQNFLDMFREGLAGGGQELAEARDRGDWKRVEELFRELDDPGDEPEAS